MIWRDQKAETGGVNVGGDVHGDVIVGYTIEQHRAALARQELRIRRDLERAHTAEKALLLQEFNEVRRQMADLVASFRARGAELERANAKLAELAPELPQARLDVARAALAQGDASKADSLFGEVEAAASEAIGRAAGAAYERGKLALADIRWADAAAHFAKAARPVPSFEHLHAAWQYAYQTGRYSEALRFRRI